jgi:hypothetical protein
MQRLTRSRHYDDNGHDGKGPKANDVEDDDPDNDKEDGALTCASDDSLSASLPNRREIGSDSRVQRSLNDGQSNLKTRRSPYYTW